MDHATVRVDFSENVALQYQDEIESAHWTQKQVTVHPVYLVLHAPDSTHEGIIDLCVGLLEPQCLSSVQVYDTGNLVYQEQPWQC